MFFKNRQIQFWYLMPNSRELRKFEVDILPIAVFGVVFISFIAFFFSLGFLNSGSNYSKSDNYFSHAIENIKLKSLKEEQAILKRKNLFLENELAKIHSANQKFKAYEGNISEKNKELANIIENAIGLGVFRYNEKNEIFDEHDGAIGGKEIYDSSSNAFQRGLSVENFYHDAYKNDEKKLLHKMSKLNKVVEKLPIGLPIIAPVSSNFGIRRSPFTGRMAKHLGIDFSKKYGSPVHATGKGKVIRATYNSTYGNMVDIRHNKNIVSRYAHLSKILVREGMTVSRGSLIGLVGSTGRSTGNHLHYEIKVNSVAVNPITFINLPSLIIDNIDKYEVASR